MFSLSMSLFRIYHAATRQLSCRAIALLLTCALMPAGCATSSPTAAPDPEDKTAQATPTAIGICPPQGPTDRASSGVLLKERMAGFVNNFWGSANDSRTGKEVTLITFKQALETASNLATEIFPDSYVETAKDNTYVYVIREGDRDSNQITLAIEPQIVLDKGGERYGIIFKTQGGGSSGWEYKHRFDDALPGYLCTAGFSSVIFSDYKMTRDQGVADLTPDFVPITYAGFRNYLDTNPERTKFEGIWETLDGRYTLGMFYNANDPRYRYQAFVIDSKSPRWKAGQIKAKFSRLTEGKVAPGILMLENKAEIGATFSLQDGILSVVYPNIDFALIQTYPTGPDEDLFTGAGTAWAVTKEGIYATNAHVIQNARKIFVGHRDRDPKRARVLMVDRRIDLALIQVTSAATIPPLPISGRDMAPNGTQVFVIGYPLAFELGDAPRITSGIISAQTGFNGDVTRYQISAPVNPGNSGGPLIDGNGNVIGIIVSRMEGQKAQATNFAIKSGYLSSLAAQAGINLHTGKKSQGYTAEQIFSRYQNSVQPVWTE